MTAVHPGPTSVQAPQIQAKMQVDFTRNPATFSVNRVIKRVPMADKLGLYRRQDPAPLVHFTGDLDENWAERTRRGTPFEAKWETQPFATQRSSENFETGTLTLTQAMNNQWNLGASFAGIAAQRQMVRRTRRVEKLVTTPANVNHDTVDNVGGGKWLGSSVSGAYIQKTVQNAKRLIMQACNGGVNPNNIIMWIGHDTALAVSQSPEYRDWLKGQPGAMDYADRMAVRWNGVGLGPTIFGCRYAVAYGEMIATSAEGAASQTTRNFLQGLGTVDAVAMRDVAVFIATDTSGDVGGLMAPPGIPSNIPINAALPQAAILAPFVEDMTTELYTDSFHRLTEGGVAVDETFLVSSPNLIYTVRSVLDDA